MPNFDELPEDASAQAAPPQGQEIASNGSAPPSFDSLQDDSEKYSTTGQQIAAGLEGAAQGLAGPLATYAETKLGVPPEDIRLRAENNPWIHGTAETGAFAASLYAGIGEAQLIAKAGEGAKILSGLGEGASLASKLGGSAVQMGTELAALQAGDEMTKAITQDPNQNLGSIVSNIGLSAALGGVTGPAFKSAGLALGKVADKVGLNQFIEDFKGRLSLNMSGANAQDKVYQELLDHHTNIKAAADEVFGPAGLKAQAIGKLVPEEFTDNIVTHAQDIDASAKAAMGEMAADPDLYPARLTKSFERDFNIFQKDINAAENPAQAYSALDEFKQRMQSYYPKGKVLNKIDPEYDFVKQTEGLRSSLKEGLENPEIWGDAANVQKSINGAFKDYLPALKDFEGKFTSKVGGVPEVDPTKVGTYLNQNGKATSTTVRQKMLGNFLDASEKYQKEIESIHSDAGLETPLKQASLAATKDTLAQLSPGSKAADIYYKKAISEASGEAAGAAVGGGLGHLVGSGPIGAWIGSQIGKSVLPSIIQPMLEKIGNSAGFEAAANFGSNVVKGESNLVKFSQNVFKSGETIPSQLIPDSDDLKKLSDKIQNVAENPSSLFDATGNLGHYMPAHSVAFSQGIMNAVNTIAQSAPKPVKNSPLDTAIEPSKEQEATYKRNLGIAEQPLMAFHYIKRGELLPQDVKTLQSLYPSYYNKMQQSIMTAMTNHLAQGNTVPYRVRQSASLFLGQPLDSTFTPQSIQAVQGMYQANSLAAHAAQNPQGGGKPKKGSPSKLNKIASNMQTSNQAREARGNKT